MWTQYILPIIALAAAIAVYLVMRSRLHALEELVRDMAEKHDRSERELAHLEKASGQTIQRLNTERQSNQATMSELRQEVAETNLRFSALHKEHEVLLEKIGNLRPGVSGESARALMDSPLAGEVASLLENGASPVEVARWKGMQVGEVTLIKSLQQFAPKQQIR